MKKLHLFLGLLLVIAFTTPSLAGNIVYVDDQLKYWLEYADDEGFIVYFTDIDTINGTQTYTITLEVNEGEHQLVAEGGEDIVNLNMVIRDNHGRILAQNKRHGSSPICKFSLDEITVLDIELTVVSFMENENSDYYSFIVLREIKDKKELILSATEKIDLTYVENELNDYMNLLVDEGCENIFDLVNLIGYTPCSYTITVGSGDYTVYAGGGTRVADLDMQVYDSNGTLVSEDSTTSNTSTCNFSCHGTATFRIEVIAFSLTEGFDEGYFFLDIAR